MTLMVLLKTRTVEGYKATKFILDEKELYVQYMSGDGFRGIKIPLEIVERILLNGVLIWADGMED